MADVSSEARLKVTVDGEERVKSLNAAFNNLKKTSGTTTSHITAATNAGSSRVIAFSAAQRARDNWTNALASAMEQGGSATKSSAAMASMAGKIGGNWSAALYQTMAPASTTAAQRIG